MNCPQCGTTYFDSKSECRTCGFSADQPESLPNVVVPMDSNKRDVLNGVGLGCSMLCFLWFFMESIVFALAVHNPHRWSTYGPLLSVGVPLVVGILMYLLLRHRPSSFTKGVGFSVLITLLLSLLFAYVGTRYNDSKPAANGAGNGFE